MEKKSVLIMQLNYNYIIQKLYHPIVISICRSFKVLKSLMQLQTLLNSFKYIDQSGLSETGGGGAFAPSPPLLHRHPEFSFKSS